MKLARIENDVAKAGLIKFTNDIHNYVLPGNIYINEYGIRGLGYCSLLATTVRYSDYYVTHTGCGNGWFSICEFKKPRGNFILNKVISSTK